MRANRSTQRLKVSKSFSVSNGFLWFRRLFGVWSCFKLKDIYLFTFGCFRGTLVVSNVLGRFFFSSEIVTLATLMGRTYLSIYTQICVCGAYSHVFVFNYSQIVFSYLNTDLSWFPPLYFSFDRFVVTFSSVVAVSRTRSGILNIRATSWFSTVYSVRGGGKGAGSCDEYGCGSTGGLSEARVSVM